MQTIEQIRDEIAAMIPGEWIVSPDGIWSKKEWGDDHVRSIRAGCLPRHGHPVPRTIDGIAALWPKDWQITIEQTQVPGMEGGWEVSGMCMFSEGPHNIKAAHGDDELEARTRLLHAVLKASAAQAARTGGSQ
jgi:hypothetical protein